VGFLTPLDTVQLPPTSTMQGIRITMKGMRSAGEKDESPSSHGCVRSNDGAAPTHPRPPTHPEVIGKRMVLQAAKSSALHSMSNKTPISPTSAVPTHRRSSRTNPTKRSRYEPVALGQGPKIARALHVSSINTSNGGHFIVDTEASHVLFRLAESAILHHVEMSPPGAHPFAVLKTANGAFMDSIGRGVLSIKTITVTAYIFRDNDLVQNLLGISPSQTKGAPRCSLPSSLNYITKEKARS
jgi:hypothetical protein